MLFEIQTRICKIAQLNSDPLVVCMLVSTPWPEIGKLHMQNVCQTTPTIYLQNVSQIIPIFYIEDTMIKLSIYHFRN